MTERNFRGAKTLTTKRQSKYIGGTPSYIVRPVNTDSIMVGGDRTLTIRAGTPEDGALRPDGRSPLPDMRVEMVHGILMRPWPLIRVLSSGA
jgi:hypothetical protein